MAVLSGRLQTNFNFLDVFQKKKTIVKFYENPPSGVELFRADGYDKLIVAFLRRFEDAAGNRIRLSYMPMPSTGSAVAR